ATFGPEAVAAIKEHFFDLAIIAISAVHVERGFMDYGEDEAIMRRAARAQAKRSVIVADSSKFGRLGSIHTFGLGDLDAVITGAPLAADFADQFRQLKVDAMMEQVSTFGGKPNGAMTRLTLSTTDGQARDWLGAWFTEHRFEQKIDPIGNQFGKLSLAGANAPT
ncbi:hypothetical protein KXV85_004038, partial [Aspergillus fumigatus]